jgi:hypothetical protein
VAPFVFADVVVMPVMELADERSKRLMPMMSAAPGWCNVDGGSCRWNVERLMPMVCSLLPWSSFADAVLPVRLYSGDLPALTTNSLPMPRSWRGSLTVRCFPRPVPAALRWLGVCVWVYAEDGESRKSGEGRRGEEKWSGSREQQALGSKWFVEWKNESNSGQQMIESEEQQASEENDREAEIERSSPVFIEQG